MKGVNLHKMIVYMRKNVWLEDFITLFPTFNAEAIGGWLSVHHVGWVERGFTKNLTAQMIFNLRNLKSP